MLNIRAIVITIVALYGVGISFKKPYYGLLLLVFLYFFRPNLWGAEVYVRPVLWLTIAVTIGWYNCQRTPDLARAGTVCIFILLFMLLSNLFAPMTTSVSWSTLLNLSKVMVVVFLITQLCNTPAKLAGFWGTVLAGNLWFVKVAVLSWMMSGYSNDVQINTAVGQGGGSNYVAWILASSIAMVFYGVSFAKGWKRIGSLVSIPLWMLSILATGSRGGLLCMLAGLGVFTIVMHRVKLVFIMAIVAVGFFVLTPQARIARAKTLTTDTKEMDGSLLARYQHIQIGTKLISKHPFFGTGLGSFPKAKLPYLPYNYAGKIEHVAHNTYIQMGSETGLVFLCFMGWLNLSLALKIYSRNPKELKDAKSIDYMQFSRVAVLAAMAATWMQMLKADLIKADFMWWIFGAAMSYIAIFDHMKQNRVTAQGKGKIPSAKLERVNKNVGEITCS